MTAGDGAACLVVSPHLSRALSHAALIEAAAKIAPVGGAREKIGNPGNLAR